MSSPLKSEVSLEPMKVEQRQRKSSRLSKKNQGDHAKRCVSSKDSKVPKTLKSLPSTESPNWRRYTALVKENPTFIKSYEDSENNKSKSSS